jgi:pimeloyl-ACP methyl ester carboxylesterase
MSLKGKLLAAGLVTGGVVGAVVAANKFIEAPVGEVDTVLTGEERRYPWKYGDMFYTVKGASSAKPLLLIHDFSPGASSFEWRKNIDALAEQFRVYAIDLLGFGLSDRPSIEYTAETYADLIGDFIKEMIGKPTIVVAHGTSAAYVIADAYRRPQLFDRLILVSPPQSILQETTPGRLDAARKFFLRMPVIGQFIYNMLTTRPVIRSYYEDRSYYNPGLVTDELVEYVYTSAHQSNARYPVASFLSGYLDMDVHEAAARLKVPAIAMWGREEAAVLPEANEAFKRVNNNIDIHVLPESRSQLQAEQATRFNQLVREFAGTTVSR